MIQDINAKFAAMLTILLLFFFLVTTETFDYNYEMLSKDIHVMFSNV